MLKHLIQETSLLMREMTQLLNIFNKRKFFNEIGTVRLNELIKQYGLYKKGQHKREKIDKLCALPNVQDIIFYEVYLHNYGSIDEFAKDIQQVSQKRK